MLVVLLSIRLVTVIIKGQLRAAIPFWKVIEMVLPRFSSGLFRAMFAMKGRTNGKEIHRWVSPWCGAHSHDQCLTRPQLSSDLGVGLSTLKKWVQQHQYHDLMSGPHEDVEKENARLHKEVRLLREEREVLKKAAIFFAGQSRWDLRSSRSGKKNGQLNFSAKLCGSRHGVFARGGCAQWASVNAMIWWSWLISVNSTA